MGVSIKVKTKLGGVGMKNEIELQCIAKEIVNVLADKGLSVKEAIHVAETVMSIINYEAKLKPLK